MGLKLNLRANERLVINGALLTALKPTSLLINNQVSMLLERHIMRPEHANTPARRVYFAIQCAYIADAAERPPYLEQAETFIKDFEGATESPKVRALLTDMRRNLEQRAYYDALKLCRDLISYEEVVLNLPSLETVSSPVPSAG
ncbi:MAG: flagellar biosynthesis repressor FlbT [Alphaproteobacteria bacterium]|nr:flagellar biosynthesis repressor FlbT [Alphaproteobacteria bacterium]